MADLQINQLPQGQPLDGTELVPVQQRGLTVQTTVSAMTAQPTLTADFLMATSGSGLANARYLSAGIGLQLTDAGAGGPLTVSLDGTTASLEFSGDGLLVKSGSTVSGTALAVSGSGLSVTNADGTTGQPTLSLAGLVANVASTVGTGLLYVSGSTATLSAGTAVNQYLQWNGTGVQWVPAFASYTQVSDDAATATPRYPLFTNITAGDLLAASVSTTELTFIPATGVLSAPVLASTVAAGTPPLVVASATQVANLYAARAGLADVATNVGGGAAGSLPYQTAGSTTTTLPLGTSGYVLTAGATAPTWAAASTITAGNASQLLGATWAAPGTIGSTTPNTGAFTTLSASGQITSTVTTGTAPFVVSSTTQVANLNAATAGAASTASVASNLTGGTTGAVAYQTGANTTTTLPLGTTGYVLTAGASAPVWAAGSTITAGNASQLLGATWAAPGTIGSTTPNTGAFTTVSASGQITSTVTTGTAPFVVASTTQVANLNASQLIGATWAAPGAIGGTTPAAGAFTTLSATGQITSTVATGTAPLVIASTTNVPNLNASSLSGATFASPGNIGGTTPSAAAFTTLSTTGRATIQSWVTGTQSIATAGATTTFAVATPFYNIFTGTLTQTVVLPNATTLAAGQRYGIDNASTGAVTIQTNGGATLWTVAAGADAYLTLTNNGTAAGTWVVDYVAALVATGKALTVNNSLTLAGTDGTTMTFPAVSSTIPSVGDVIAYALALG